MNILLDKLPQKMDGMDINSDFRVMMLFELLTLDLSISKKEKIILSLKLLYKNVEQIKNIKEAMDSLLWFYRGGDEVRAAAGGSLSKKKQIYSYECDSLYIYSAFMQQYHIDLNDIEYLHWWKFKALFNNLEENTQMVKIMGYRNANLNDFGKDKKMKDFYLKMKKQYELPDMRSEEEKEADMEASFW